MTKISKQTSFEDVPLDVSLEVLQALEKVLDGAQSVSDYNAANRIVKEAIPAVNDPTRFLVGNEGEGYIIIVNPYTAKEHKVRGGERRRLTVKPMEAAGQE